MDAVPHRVVGRGNGVQPAGSEDPHVEAGRVVAEDDVRRSAPPSFGAGASPGDAHGVALAIADDTVAEMRQLRERVSRNHSLAVLALSYLRSLRHDTAGFEVQQAVKFLTRIVPFGRKAGATAARVHQCMVLVQGWPDAVEGGSGGAAGKEKPVGSVTAVAEAVVNETRVGSGPAVMTEGETGSM